MHDDFSNVFYFRGWDPARDSCPAEAKRRRRRKRSRTFSRLGHSVTTVGLENFVFFLKNPLKINNVVTDQLGRQSQRFIGQFGEVVVNPRTGRIISVNPTSSSKAAKLLKQLGR